MSKGSPAFTPAAFSASLTLASAIVAISTSERSCAMTSFRIQVAEPERSLWSASTTGVAPCATACFASFTPSGMVWTVVEPSSASRRRHAARCHVVGDLARQGGIAVGHDLERHADIRHVGERKAEEEIHIDVGLARLPGERALHQVHPRRGAGPLQHRRRDDRHVLRDGRRARSRRGSPAPACAPRVRPAGGCRSAGSISRGTPCRRAAGTPRPRCRADRRCRR